MLADGVAAQAATWAVMMALYHRDSTAAGQLVDVNLVEPLARLIESSTLAFDQLGTVTGRVGNHLAASAPRNAYRTADDKWLVISSASANIVVRVLPVAIGRPDLAEDPDYVDPVGRRRGGTEIDAMVAEWVAQRTLDEAMQVFLDANVAAAPVYDARQLLGDEHLRSRGPSPGRRPRPRTDTGCRRRWPSSRTLRDASTTGAKAWEPRTMPSTVDCSASVPTASPPFRRTA